MAVRLLGLLVLVISTDLLSAATLASTVSKIAGVAKGAGGLKRIVAKKGTTQDFDTQFIAKCNSYNAKLPAGGKNCKNLLTMFNTIWVGKDPCSVPKTDFKEFIDATSIVLPTSKALFWSGAKDQAQMYAQLGVRMYTLESTFVGHLLDGLMFCGEKKTKANSTGINYYRCPNWGDLTCKNYVMKNFWEAASAWFAKSASGIVKVIIGGWRKPAYSPTSIFKSIELPAMVRSKVTEISVWMVDEKLENCKSTSLKQMETDVKRKGFKFNCKNNPSLKGLDKKPANDLNKTTQMKTGKEFVKSNNKITEANTDSNTKVTTGKKG